MFAAGHCSDPRVTHLAEEVGLAVPLTMVLSWVSGPKIKPQKDYATPGETIADYEMRTGFFHGTDGQIQLLASAAGMMKLDGFIAHYLYNCRPAAMASHSQQKYLAEKTGLPVLSLEIDNYDSRAYSAASLRTRVETFADMLKIKKHQ